MTSLAEIVTSSSVAVTSLAVVFGKTVVTSLVVADLDNCLAVVALREMIGCPSSPDWTYLELDYKKFINVKPIKTAKQFHLNELNEWVQRPANIAVLQDDMC